MANCPVREQCCHLVGISINRIREEMAIELSIVLVFLWCLVLLGPLEELGNAVVRFVILDALDALVPGKELCVGRRRFVLREPVLLESVVRLTSFLCRVSC
jgi:hypothetical protein